MNGWRIRCATLADAESLSAIVQTLIPDWLVPDGDVIATARLQREHSAETIASRIRDDWPHWLAESTTSTGANEVFGYIALRPPAHLFNCYVRVDWHGAGVGTALWQVLADHVNARGETAVTVNASLRSSAFYQRLGFVVVTKMQCFEGLYFQPMRYAFSSEAPRDFAAG